MTSEQAEECTRLLKRSSSPTSTVLATWLNFCQDRRAARRRRSLRIFGRSHFRSTFKARASAPSFVSSPSLNVQDLLASTLEAISALNYSFSSSFWPTNAHCSPLGEMPETQTRRCTLTAFSLCKGISVQTGLVHQSPTWLCKTMRGHGELAVLRLCVY